MAAWKSAPPLTAGVSEMNAVACEIRGIRPGAVDAKLDLPRCPQTIGNVTPFALINDCLSVMGRVESLLINHRRNDDLPTGRLFLLGELHKLGICLLGGEASGNVVCTPP